MKCIIATHNDHKAAEIRKYLGDLFEEVVTLGDIGFGEEIEENGTTFFNNAWVKAQTILNKYPDCAVISDDSGICIDHLDDQPGVYSARFLGEKTDATTKNKAVLKLLEGVSNRKARFVCCMVYLEKNHTFFTCQEVRGTIAQECRGHYGFGYNPIFIPDGYTVTFGEDDDLKNQISHRSKAVKAVSEHVAFYKK